MRLSDGSFAPPTLAEEQEHIDWESDIDRAVVLTEHGRTFDPFMDDDLLHMTIDRLTGDQRQELSAAFHMGNNEVFGELLAQALFKTAFAEAWRSLRPEEDVPDV